MLSCLSLLLAVTSAVQQAAPAPAPHARAHRRARAVTSTAFVSPVTALEAGARALAAAQPDLEALTIQAPVLAMAASDLEMAAYSLSAAPVALAAPMVFLDGDDHEEISEPKWPAQAQADVADSLYRAARQALNQNQYDRAAELFRSIRDRYPRSTYVPNTYYWQAFALYRAGSDDNLRDARTALQTQADRYPKATTGRDARVLLRRIQGELARRGDSDAAEDVSRDADLVAPTTPPIAAVPGTPAIVGAPTAPGAPMAIAGTPGVRNGACDDDDDDDMRIAALNAVLQMDPDRAVPLLKTVLARRDAGSACLRRKAVFLVSQKRSDQTTAILLNAVRTDPDQEVREQAVFWLSQVPGDETVAALDSILRDPKTPPAIQEKAIFALSQHRSARAGAILRDFAARRDANIDLREKAIFWIGQSRSPENAQFLKDLYAKVENDDLKEKIIFSLSQMGGADNYRWLMDIALNQAEDIEIRKKALFWAGQGHNVDVADLVRLYDSMKDRDMREQLIFVYSQRREDAALDKLFDIGKNDPDRELRKKAIFWIGQSRSPRAADYLQQLINQ
jgi:TolA-binding protein/HEAT repeat protein